MDEWMDGKIVLRCWCYLHPTTNSLFMSGLAMGPAQVPFLVPVARFPSVHDAKISIQISVNLGPGSPGSLMAANVTTKLPHTLIHTYIHTYIHTSIHLSIHTSLTVHG